MTRLRLKTKQRGSATKFWLAAASLVFLLPFFAIAVIPTLKSVESTLMPAVSDFKFEVVSRDEGGVVVQVYGVKNRDCEYKRLSAATLTNDARGKGWVKFLDAGPETSRLPGKQNFGRWRIEPKAEYYDITSAHDCHSAWETTTHLGRVKYGP